MKRKGESKYLKWVRLLNQKQETKLVSCWERASPIEVAGFLEKFLEQQSPTQVIAVFTSLSVEQQGEIFSLFKESALQMQFYSNMPKSTFAKIFSSMPSDLRVDFYQKLSSRDHAHLLPYLSKKVREDVMMLSAYSPDTAGGIMSTEFATVFQTMTVGEALERIREDAPARKLLYYIYVIDEAMRLVGVVSLKDLVIRSPQEKLEGIALTSFIYAMVEEDQEVVAKKIEQYNLVALPVLNSEEQIVGVVSYDDALNVIRAEQIEDMDKFVGITTEDSANYLKVSSLQHLRKRMNWIVVVFIAGIFSQSFAHAKSSFFTPFNLVLYIGMITDTGGNVGSQTAAVVLQALNRGQINLSDWLRVVLKEFQVAFMLATILFVLAYGKVYIINWLEPGMATANQIPWIVSLSVGLQVMCSTFVGAMMPLAAKYFKGDPAVAANPAINTTVEFLGVLIYYAVISCFMPPDSNQLAS